MYPPIVWLDLSDLNAVHCATAVPAYADPIARPHVEHGFGVHLTTWTTVH